MYRRVSAASPLEEDAHGRLGAPLAHGESGFAPALVVGVPFDEHERAGVLEDSAHVILHRPSLRSDNQAMLAALTRTSSGRTHQKRAIRRQDQIVD